MSFWEGRRQKESDLLDALIPEGGEVEFDVNNHALELYRLYCNAYYDIYNNGACNWDSRGKGMRQILGVYGLKGSVNEFLTAIRRDGYSPALEHIGDVVMDAAMKEQWGVGDDGSLEV